MKRKFTAALVVIAFTLSANTAFSQKLLLETNHSFLEGFKNWKTGTWGDARSKPEATFVINTSDGHDDKASVKIDVKKDSKDNPGKVFLRTSGIKLKKGKTYTIEFWAKSRVAADSVRLLIYSSEETGSRKEWGGIVDQDLRFLGDGTWQQLTLTFEAKDKFPGAPADYHKIGIAVGFGGRKGVYQIDNFRLVRLD